MDYSLSDNIEVVGYIDKNYILSCFREEEIFKLVFGFEPVEYQYTTSPFRMDNNPGCWFERSLHSNKLEFIDYADPLFNKQDCFSCVKRFFKLPNFYSTLVFIQKSLKDRVNIERKCEYLAISTPKEKKKVEIYIKPRNFIQSDKLVWFKYGITRKQLTEDKVIPVSKYVMTNTKKGTIIFDTYTHCYSFSEFEGNRKKLYFPYKTGKRRFITNCNQNDIGGLNNIVKGKQLVITKSYKDCRVLRNQGVNCIWFQNEGMFPNKEILKDIIKDFKDIIIFFDNDETGLIASDKAVEYISKIVPKTKVRKIYLDEELLCEKIKDSSDAYYYKGKEYLINFLKKNKIYVTDT